MWIRRRPPRLSVRERARRHAVRSVVVLRACRYHSRYADRVVRRRPQPRSNVPTAGWASPFSARVRVPTTFSTALSCVTMNFVSATGRDPREKNARAVGIRGVSRSGTTARVPGAGARTPDGGALPPLILALQHPSEKTEYPHVYGARGPVHEHAYTQVADQNMWRN